MVEHLSIFLDESGDLGFDWSKQGTSKYFVVAVLVCEGVDVARTIKKAVIRTLKNKLNGSPDKKRKIHELKGAKTTIEIKQYFYRHLPEEGWGIYAITLNKREVYPYLQTKKGSNKLYNFISRFLIEKIPIPESIKTINLVLDKCKNSSEIQDFNHYLQNQLEGVLPRLDVRLDISHESSQDNPGLQAIDMFCWGIARKYSHDDISWYEKFKNQIYFETVYLE